MIARPENEKSGIWAQLAAALPSDVVQWRQQGKAKPRDGKWFAPFVAYIDAQFVRERLDETVPGEWDLTLELLPAIAHDGDVEEAIAFKARLQVLGVIREDVGTGRDYKTAATDAFKRAAVRFGVGHELYTDYEFAYVQVDGDGKFAKPLEDPATVYARKHGAGVKSANAVEPSRGQRAESGSGNDADRHDAAARQQAAPVSAPSTNDNDPPCPRCGGKMWDNRQSKRNPKAPDFACKDKACAADKGVIWPPKNGAAPSARQSRGEEERDHSGTLTDLPF